MFWALSRAVFLSKSTCNKRLGIGRVQTRCHTSTSSSAPWRQTAIVDEWLSREARPVSLRQLTVFGRSLTKKRLIDSANYVRMELPTRIAHRLRDMEILPYVVLTNSHMSHVYHAYLKALDDFRRVSAIITMEDNAAYCDVLQKNLTEHLSVIPRLVMGFLECQHLLEAELADRMMNALLKSRISRRVIAEQHIALTKAFGNQGSTADPTDDLIGEVFLHCHAKELVERCVRAIDRLSRLAYGPDVQLPEVVMRGHHAATLTYIPAHLEYIIGELLRNSYQAVIEQGRAVDGRPCPIEVLICEAPQHVIFRISDQGGGVPRDVLPYLWSFTKGPRKGTRLDNLTKVPYLSATLQELGGEETTAGRSDNSSLTSLYSRPPDLRLGIGLPMSRMYAEYWAGSLELHSLEGFGVDAFLQVSKLGNKNEQLSTRAAMDAL